MVEEEIEVEQEVEEQVVPKESLMGIGGLDVEIVEDKEVEEKAPVIEVEKEEVMPQEDKDKEEEEKDKDKKASIKEVINKQEVSLDWDADDNPYKKRFLDTKNWGTKVNQDKLMLEHQNEALEANIADIRKELELADYTPSSVESPKEEFRKRLAMSESATYLAYGDGDIKKGAEIVDKLIGIGSGFLELAQNNPVIKQRFLGSISPAAEAILIMKEQKQLNAFGNKTPEEIKVDIRKEIEEELKTKEEIKNKLKDAPKGLPRKQGDTRGNDSKQEGVASLSSLSGLGN